MRKLLCVFLLVTGCGRAPRKPVWIVEGCASTSRVTYNMHQISAKALEHAAENLNSYNTVLFAHNSERPVGRIETLEFKHQSIFVTIIISPSEQTLWNKIREGTITGLSIGVLPLEQEFTYFDEFDEGGQTATKVVLLEVSIVSIPANPDCRITSWRIRYE